METVKSPAGVKFIAAVSGTESIKMPEKTESLSPPENSSATSSALGYCTGPALTEAGPMIRITVGIYSSLSGWFELICQPAMTLASTSKLLVPSGASGWSSFSAVICTTSFAFGSANAGAAHAKPAHSAQIRRTRLLGLSQSEIRVLNRDGGFNVQSVASRGLRAPPLPAPRVGQTEAAASWIRFARYMFWYNVSRNFGVP